MPKPQLPGFQRVLVVAAHPDDIESWCAGTLALLVDGGAAVHYLLCTRGDKGSAAPAITGEEVARIRELEQREAAASLGVASVEFLPHLDGFLEDAPELREQLVRAIRTHRPEVVFTHDSVHPYPPYTVHRDHRVAGRTVLDAAYPMARDRLYFPEHEAEGLLPHKVRELWLFGSAQPDTWVDITESLDRKVTARLAHRSQTGNPEALRRDWLRRAEEIGMQAGIGPAEAFKVVPLEE